MFQDFTKITKSYPSEKLDNECRHISFLNYSPKIPSFLIFSYCIIISIINLTDEDSMPSTAKHFFNIFTSPIIIDKKKKKKKLIYFSLVSIQLFFSFVRSFVLSIVLLTTTYICVFHSKFDNSRINTCTLHPIFKFMYNICIADCST